MSNYASDEAWETRRLMEKMDDLTNPNKKKRWLLYLKCGECDTQLIRDPMADRYICVTCDSVLRIIVEKMPKQKREDPE